MLDEMKDYSPLTDSDVRLLRTRKDEGFSASLFVLQTPFGYRRTAQLFQPEGDGPFPAILFIHWFEPGAPTSNRSQFVEEAKELARAGAVCLTVETLWSDNDFFIKRTQADDAQNSIEEVVNLRRALDLLLSQPGVDAKRVALVGHDFGGLYGVLTGSIDQRPTHYVIMAATPRFADWYLYQPPLEGEDRIAFIDEMAAIDPIHHVANLSPAPVFFQFAYDDAHVPTERAIEFFEAARSPKEMKTYHCGHGLNQDAAVERVKWLREKLGL